MMGGKIVLSTAHRTYEDKTTYSTNGTETLPELKKQKARGEQKEIKKDK